MFNQAFFTKIELILATLHDAEAVSLPLLGRCLSDLKRCLAEAEVDASNIAQFTDIALDLYAAAPAVRGIRFAAELRHLLDEVPGLTGRYSELAWSDTVLRAARGVGTPARWDFKELDNSLVGSNRASLGRLRMAGGLVSERRFRGAVDLHRDRRFEARGGMHMSDRHDAGIDGEQVNRLIQYLNRDDDGMGGRHAMLG